MGHEGAPDSGLKLIFPLQRNETSVKTITSEMKINFKKLRVVLSFVYLVILFTWNLFSTN